MKEHEEKAVTIDHIQKFVSEYYQLKVIHSIRKVEALRKEDSQFNSLLNSFLESLR